MSNIIKATFSRITLNGDGYCSHLTENALDKKDYFRLFLAGDELLSEQSRFSILKEKCVKRDDIYEVINKKEFHSKNGLVSESVFVDYAKPIYDFFNCKKFREILDGDIEDKNTKLQADCLVNMDSASPFSDINMSAFFQKLVTVSIALLHPLCVDGAANNEYYWSKYTTKNHVTTTMNSVDIFTEENIDLDFLLGEKISLNIDIEFGRDYQFEIGINADKCLKIKSTTKDINSSVSSEIHAYYTETTVEDLRDKSTNKCISGGKDFTYRGGIPPVYYTIMMEFEVIESESNRSKVYDSLNIHSCSYTGHNGFESSAKDPKNAQVGTCCYLGEETHSAMIGEETDSAMSYTVVTSLIGLIGLAMEFLI